MGGAGTRMDQVVADYVDNYFDTMPFRHWDVPTGKCLHTMTGHTASVNAVLISSDGSKAVSGSSDTTIRVWNTDSASR